MITLACIVQMFANVSKAQIWTPNSSFDALQIGASNKLYLGGRNAAAPISWNAYPSSAAGWTSQYAYSNATAAQIRYEAWGQRLIIGMSDPLQALVYGTNVNWTNAFVIGNDGNIGVGILNGADRLHIANGSFAISNNGTKNFKVDQNGFVIARQFDVNLLPIPDFVFKKEYELMPINILEKYLCANKHLPGIKSESEYQKAGSINLGELNMQMLQKIEELTLYIIEMQKQIDQLKAAQLIKH